MSVRVIAQVFRLELPPVPKFVLVALADHADHDGFSVRPTVGYVARKTGYSARSVRRALRELERRGFVEEILAPRGHRPREYRMILPFHISTSTADVGGQSVPPGRTECPPYSSLDSRHITRRFAKNPVQNPPQCKSLEDRLREYDELERSVGAR
jgi:hypothetical protein